MDDEYYVTLAKVRLERSEELLAEAKDLLSKVLTNLQITELFTQSKRV